MDLICQIEKTSNSVSKDQDDNESLASTIGSDNERQDNNESNALIGNESEDLQKDMPRNESSSSQLNETLDYCEFPEDDSISEANKVCNENLHAHNSNLLSQNKRPGIVSGAKSSKSKKRLLTISPAAPKTKQKNKNSVKQLVNNTAATFLDINKVSPSSESVMLTSTPRKECNTDIVTDKLLTGVIFNENQSKTKFVLNSGKKEEWKTLKPMARVLAKLGLDLVRENVCVEVIKNLKKKDALEIENDVKKVDTEYAKLNQKNKRFKCHLLTCKFCAFQTESVNVLELHCEFAHIHNDGGLVCAICGYKCTREAEFMFHMEAEHNREGRLFPKKPFYVCPMCPHENRSLKTFKSHVERCAKSFSRKQNLYPSPADSDIPIKKAKKKLKNLATTLSLSVGEALNNVIFPRPPVISNGLPSMPDPATMRSSAPPISCMANMLSSLPYVPPVQPFAINPSWIPTDNNGRLPQQFCSSQLPISIPIASVKPQVITAADAVLRQNNLLSNINFKRIVSTMSRSLDKQPYVTNTEVCEICDSLVRGRVSLQTHFSRAHRIEMHIKVLFRKLPPMSCDRCFKRFWTFRGLIRHLNMFHKTDILNDIELASSYTCKLCGLKQIKYVLAHLRDAHRISVEQVLAMKKCPCCGLFDNLTESLCNHIVSFHRELASDPAIDEYREFYLTAFGQNLNLVQNNVSCGNPFMKLSRRLGYALPVECTFCSEVFRNMEDYEEHCIECHSFRCFYCNEKCSSSMSVDVHLRENHGNEKRLCPLCEHVIPIGEPFINHMKDYHLQQCSVKLNRIDNLFRANSIFSDGSDDALECDNDERVL